MTRTKQPWKELSPLSEQRVDSMIERVRSAGRALGDRDVSKLATAAYSSLMEETNWQLRQILTQIHTEVDLGLDEGEGLSRERAERVLQAVDRATTVVDACLDRNEITKRFIRLTPEPFDLGQAMRSYLEHNGFLEEGETVRFPVEPAPIEGDRIRLVNALGYLFDRFYQVAEPGETVVGDLRWEEDEIRGFVGLDPSHLSADVLIEDLSKPLVVEDLRFDVPLARAIVERHGGLVFVDQRGETATGFGFTLPALDPGIRREETP